MKYLYCIIIVTVLSTSEVTVYRVWVSGFRFSQSDNTLQILRLMQQITWLIFLVNNNKDDNKSTSFGFISNIRLNTVHLPTLLPPYPSS